MDVALYLSQIMCVSVYVCAPLHEQATSVFFVAKIPMYIIESNVWDHINFIILNVRRLRLEQLYETREQIFACMQCGQGQLLLARSKVVFAFSLSVAFAFCVPIVPHGNYHRYFGFGSNAIPSCCQEVLPGLTVP